MARPIPVSNQKIRDWNLFLAHLNERASNELPKDASGKTDWSVLDKNEAFGTYTGGQDFYKKKFAEWASTNNITGNDRLTEADFPVMQKLYEDTYVAAQNDPEYFKTHIQPTLDGQSRLYGLDVSSYNPVSTATGKDNKEGWVGSVSRNFFIPQETTMEAKGGGGKVDTLSALFPKSFQEKGDTWWSKNAGNLPGVKFTDQYTTFGDGGLIPSKKQKNPVMGNGGTIPEAEAIASSKKLLSDNKNLDFVTRVYFPDAITPLKNKDGSTSTHKMAWGENDNGFVVYPTIVNAGGKLVELPDDEASNYAAYNYAMKNGEYIKVPDAKTAKFFADGGYKQAAGWNSAEEKAKNSKDLKSIGTSISKKDISEKVKKQGGWKFGEGGRIMCEDGAEIKEGVAEVEGKTHEEGGEDVTVKGKTINVEKGEIIDMTGKDGRIYSNNEELIYPKTGKNPANTYKDAQAKIDKFKGDKRDIALNVVKAAQKLQDDVFEWQQSQNGNANTNVAEDGTLVDGEGDGQGKGIGPKKRLFFVPEDKTVYQVDEDKVLKHKDKLKNAVEYTDIKPDGYNSETHYIEKNGVLAEVPTNMLYAALNSEAGKGSREIYPVQTTGQKKNQDVQSVYNEISDPNSIFKPNTVGIEDISVSKKEVDDYEAKKKTYVDFIDKIPREEGQTYTYNDILELDFLEKLYPNDIEYLRDASRDMRDAANKDIGTFLIDKAEKNKDLISSNYMIANSSGGATMEGIHHISKTQQFKDFIDKELNELPSIEVDGKSYNFKQLSDGQKEEIRNYVVSNYQTVQDLKRSNDRIKFLTSTESTGDAATDDLRKQQQQAIFNKTGIDITTLFSEEDALKKIDDFTVKQEEINKQYSSLVAELPSKIKKETDYMMKDYMDQDKQLVEASMKNLNDLATSLGATTVMGEDGKPTMEFPNQEAIDLYNQEFQKVEVARTDLFNKFNREQNNIAQQKMDFAVDALKIKYDSELYDALKEAGLEGDDILKKVQLYNKLVLWETQNIQKDASLRFEKEAERLVNYKGDWEQVKTNFNRATLSMFEGIGGGLKWAGWYEAGNILSDSMDEFNLANPDKPNVEHLNLFNPQTLLNKDAWIQDGPGWGVFAATMIVPGATVAGVTGGLAARWGLTGVGAQLFQGFAGALATRPMENFITVGSQFNLDLQNGLSIEESSDRASTGFTNRLSLIALDSFQLGFGFTKIGRFTGWKAGLVKMPIEMLAEGFDESYDELVTEKLDNPMTTYIKFMQMPAGQQSFTGGLIMGAPFALVDVASITSGKKNQQQLGLLMDMMGDPNNLDIRYKEIMDQANVLKSRGMMTDNEFQDLMSKAEFVLTKGKDIPIDLAPEIRKTVLYKLADIQDANNVIAQSQDETIKKTYQDKIKELEKEVKGLISGKQPTYFIGNASYTKEEFDAMMSNDEIVSQLADQNTPIQVFNDPKMQQNVELRISQFKPNNELIYDSKNKTGVQSSFRTGQESVKTESNEGTSGKTSEPDRMVQEEINYPESALTDEEEQSLSDSYDAEAKLIEGYYAEKNQEPPSQEEIDAINSTFTTDERGQIFDLNNEPTTIEEVVTKYNTLKEGTVFESGDGKVRYVREEGEIVRRDAKGNRVEIQKYKTVKGKKTKVNAPEGTTFLDAKKVKTYDQERLDAGVEEGEITESEKADEIAETSNNPTQIKEAWEEEKVRLRDEVDTENKVYEAVKENGIQAKDWNQNGDKNLVKDGSVSAIGWFSNKALPIDTLAQQAGVEVQDVIDFIQKYGKGAHEYKAQRNQTLKALEDRYKKITGVNIKSTVSKTPVKTQPKVEVKKEVVKEPTYSDKAKKVADFVRKAKGKERKIIVQDEEGNDVEIDLMKNSLWDEAVEVAALVIEQTGKVADGLKAVKDWLNSDKAPDWYKKLNNQNKQKVQNQVLDEIKKASGVSFKKKERGLSKTTRKTELEDKKEVKSLLDKDPLFYNQVSNAESIEKAKEFIDENGIEDAEELALDRNVSVQDALMANTLGLVLMDYYGKQAALETDPRIKMKLLNKVVSLSEVVAERMTLAGQQGQVMAIWTKMSPEAALLSVKRAIKRQNESPQGQKRITKFKGAQKGYKGEQEQAAKKVITSDRVKKIKGEKVLSDVQKEINEQKKREHAAIDKFVDKYLNTNTGGMMLSAPIPPGVIKGTINVLVKAIKAGIEIKAAIKKAIAYLKDQMGNADVDYDKAEKWLEKFHSDMLKDVEVEIKKPLTNIEESVRTSLRERNKKIDEIIKSHFTEREETKQELIDRLVKETGVSESTANELAIAIEEEFVKITKGGAAKLIEKYFGKIEKKGKITEDQKAAKRDENSTISQINKTLNLNGLVDEKLLLEYFGERFGIKTLSNIQIENILKYSEAVQKTEGKFKERATQQLVQEISRLYGASAMDIYWALWYPSMLSGLSTSTINVTNNAANVVSKYFENPLNPSLYFKALKDAIKNKSAKTFLYGNPLAETLLKPIYFFGKKALARNQKYTFNEMLDIMQKGMLDDKFADRQFQGGQKVEMSALEDKRIANIHILKYLEFYKYVGRFLQAQDALFFRNNEESEFISSVRRQFVENGLTGKELFNAVYDEVVGSNDHGAAIAKMEAEAKVYEEITGNTLNKAQRAVRLIEILREGRNQEAVNEAKEAAETMVYRGDYRGGIGTIAYMLSTITQSKNPASIAIRMYVPFTKIVSNVFNYMIDYTPVYGMLRANGLGITGLYEKIHKGPLKYMHKELKSTQMGEKGSKAYYDQMGRAWVGLGAFTTLAAIIASQLDMDDDDEDKIFLVGSHAGLTYEQSKSMEKTDPKGTIRIGKNGTPIPYRMIAALDVPLTILGNWVDLNRWGDGKGSAEKLGMSILASKNTFLEKSFVKGVNDLVTTVFDSKINGADKKATELLKTALGYATKPLPQNSTLVTQIDDIFSKYEYTADTIEDILKYAAYNGWNLDKPKLDVFGYPIKTYPGEQLLPIQHWFNLQENDDVWKKLADKNLTKKIGKFADLHLFDEEGHPLPVTDDQQYIYKAYVGREWYKMLNEYLSDEDKARELLDWHEVEYEEIGPEQWKKVVELTKEDAAKIAYYRIAKEYGLKYDLNDLDWVNYIPTITLDEVEE